MTEEARECNWAPTLSDMENAIYERDALAAENARLRAAIGDTLTEWWIDLGVGPIGAKCVPIQEFIHERIYYIVPPHIAALQDAIYREEGE